MDVEDEEEADATDPLQQALAQGTQAALVCVQAC